MPFRLLKQVIGHLRRQSRCPICQSKFTEESIFVLATSMLAHNGTCNGLFFIVCPKCTSQAFVMAEVTAVMATLQEENVHFQTKPANQKINMNEILDMHNFLKDWEGDVTELFKEMS
ncbi:MAG: hypothetical protein AAB588_05375 [Patescibacteria group bacterium]